MRNIVVMPGGFHPFHAGHAALYKSAVEAFNNADVYVAATNDTKTRPFPFSIKEKLAKLAGVADKHFIQVKSPFKAEEITRHYNPNEDILIFVRSEKDKTEQPKPGGTKKDGSPAYFQPYTGKNLQPFSKHAYIAYLPTVEFGPGIKSATEIRNAWPKLDDRRKTAMVMSLYPVTQKNPKLAANVVKMLDMGMGEQQAVAEGSLNEFAVDGFGDSGDNRSKLLATVGRLFDAGNKVDWQVPGQMGHVTRVQDDGIIMKKWQMPRSKMSFFLPMRDDSRDSKYTIKMVAPKHYAVVSAEQGVAEARRNPERNLRAGSGKYDLINYAEDIRDKDNWAVSMTMEPKLGINPQAAVSEDTPKGIYFYPLKYFMQMADRDESLPWGDDFPYMQLFQYDRSGEMTEQTQVDPAKLRQALSQYCSDEIMQQAAEEDEYDGTPYWYIYDCLSRLGKGDETNVIRWNKVLRDLGFTSVFDPGRGWIAHNEPTQGVILDPRVIKAHKMFDNRNPTMQHRRYDVQSLADSIGWSSYFQRESQLQKVYNHPDEKKVRLDVAKSMLKPFLGKSSEEAKEMGYDQALKDAADKVIEILKQQDVDENIKVEPVAKSLRIQSTQIQPKQNVYVAPEKKTPAVVNHIKPKEVKEGDVVPFKQPSKTLTWQQVPKDILLLANDWFWASEDNSGLDATIDPEGFGNGTANDVKYNAAKLQQKGWTIDFNDEYDAPGEFNLRLTNKRGQTVLLSIEDAQDFTGWAKGTSQYDLEETERTAKVFHPQYVDVYYLDGPRRTPILVNRKIPYNLVDRYLELAIKKYNLQQGRFEFRNAEEDLAEFAPPGNDEREPDEEEILRQLAAQWWYGTEQQMAKAQKTLATMGWEIGQDESGDDDAGVFVIRPNDMNGDSYIAFGNNDLKQVYDSMNESCNQDYLNEE